MRDYKTLFETNTQSIIDKNGELKIISNYTNVAVLPYVINDSGIFSKVGVIENTNYYDKSTHKTLIDGYRINSDSSCMVTANRLLFEHTKTNITEAESWMFLGDIYSKNSGTPLKLYCVNVSDIENDINENGIVKFIKINEAITSDDSLLLASYLRLFNLYYTQNIGK